MAQLVGTGEFLTAAGQVLVDMDKFLPVALVVIAVDAAQRFQPHQNMKPFCQLKGVTGSVLSAQAQNPLFYIHQIPPKAGFQPENGSLAAAPVLFRGVFLLCHAFAQFQTVFQAYVKKFPGFVIHGLPVEHQPLLPAFQLAQGLL